jgi:hypothetical protein
MSDALSESSLILSIRNYFKAIPYPGSGLRPDGTENHGCKIMKGRVGDADLIPEALDNASLRNAIIALNASDTPFLTLGCEKSCNKVNGGEGYWMKGFLEISFNYAHLMANAQNYFKLFFDFNHWFWDQPKTAAVLYDWHLEGAEFIHQGAKGFTVVFWISTLVLPTEEDAQRAWSWALDTLVSFLTTVPNNPAMPGRLY